MAHRHALENFDRCIIVLGPFLGGPSSGLAL